MKKLLLIVGAVILLAAAAMAVFIATFDADRYRPLVVAELQKALNRPVTLQRMSLGWRNGIAAELQGLAVADPPAAEPLLELESATAHVRLWPLLRRQVQVTAVTLMRPRIHVVRDAQGRINLLGAAVVAAPAAAAEQGSAGATAGIALEIASVQLRDGTLHWTDATAQPLPELWVRRLDVTARPIVPGRPMQLEVRAAVFAQEQNVRCSGRLMLPTGTSAGALEQVTLAADGLPLQTLLPAAEPGAPALRGTLALQAEGALPSFNPLHAALASSGEGRVRIAEPVIENLNLLRTVFDRLSMLPGLVQQLQARLPASYQAKLAARDTVLESIDVSARLESGALRFEDLQLRSDTFRLLGRGTVGVTGGVQIASRLQIEPELSAAIIRSVAELGALTNRSGEIEIPLAIQGQMPRLAVLPDLNYIASKVVVTKAVDVLERLLRPKAEPSPEASPQASPEATAPQQPPTTEELIGGLLQRALRKHLPQETPSQ
ncbi:MAG: AsmA family protein [Candidatus Omnitrophica bacterium]|nr:AsmA family protein [Candidatus Omnitrophota bacterium]